MVVDLQDPMKAGQQDVQVQEVLGRVLYQLLERMRGLGKSGVRDGFLTRKSPHVADEIPQAVTALRSIECDRVKRPRCEDKPCVNEAELDEYFKSTPTIIAALPTKPTAIAKLAERKPGDQEPGHEEQLFMVDSGAGTNGAKRKKCPGLQDPRLSDEPTWSEVRCCERRAIGERRLRELERRD